MMQWVRSGRMARLTWKVQRSERTASHGSLSASKTLSGTVCPLGVTRTLAEQVRTVVADVLGMDPADFRIYDDTEPRKPVLRGGLYRDRALWEVEQPGALLRRCFAEGRRIDYFYSDSDESSNASLIEYVRDAEGLVKHRIGGAHAAVAKRSLPTVLALLRRFPGLRTVSDEVEFRSYHVIYGLTSLQVTW